MTSSMRQIDFSTDQNVDFICFGENLWCNSLQTYLTILKRESP